MAIEQDAILSLVLTELREHLLIDFRNMEKGKENRYEYITGLSQAVNGILSTLNEEQRNTVQTLMAEKESLNGDEMDYLYLNGVKDGIRLLRFLNII